MQQGAWQPSSAQLALGWRSGCGTPVILGSEVAQPVSCSQAHWVLRPERSLRTDGGSSSCWRLCQCHKQALRGGFLGFQQAQWLPHILGLN